MASEEKLTEARLEATEILALSPQDVTRVFYAEMKRKKLSKLVRRLDQLALNGGEDARLGTLALERLGFSG